MADQTYPKPDTIPASGSYHQAVKITQDNLASGLLHKALDPRVFPQVGQIKDVPGVDASEPTDAEIATLVGKTYVINKSFDKDMSGWTASSGSPTISDGGFAVTPNTSDAMAYQDHPDHPLMSGVIVTAVYKVLADGAAYFGPRINNSTDDSIVFAGDTGGNFQAEKILHNGYNEYLYSTPYATKAGDIITVMLDTKNANPNEMNFKITLADGTVLFSGTLHQLTNWAGYNFTGDRYTVWTNRNVVCTSFTVEA